MGDYADEVLADAPIAFWKLNEASGSTAVDSAGNFNGNYIGSPERVNALVFGETGAMRAVSINQFVETALNQSLNVFTAELVFVAEVIPPSGSVATLIAHRSYYASSTTAFPFALQINSSGILSASFSIGDDFSNDLTLSSQQAVEIGKPYHVAAKRDADGNCSLRLNKVPVTGTLLQNLSSYSGPWTIGRSNEYGGGVNTSSFLGISCLGAVYNYAVPDVRLDLHADLAVKELLLTVDIDENLAADEFVVSAHRLPDMTKSYTEILAAGAHNITIPFHNAGPHVVMVTPAIGDIWQSEQSVIVGQKSFPTDPQSTPYYFRCTIAGTTGSTEPPWQTGSPGALTDDGDAQWELVERMVQPITHGPLIPI